MNHEYKTAIVTGASSGIGLEFARILARNKINVVLVARSEDKLKALAAELQKSYNVQTHVIKADLSKNDSASSLFKQIEKLKITPDILVNNAGLGDQTPFLKSESQTNELQITTNIITLTHLTRLILPGMVERKKGIICNVGSVGGFQPGPGMSVYYATKAYVNSFSEALSIELGRTGVTVTCLSPGATQSGFHEAADNHSILTTYVPMPTSKEVAEYGFKMMMRGRTVAIHGIINNLLIFSERFTPRKLVAIVSGWLNGPVRSQKR